jgi:hypothetical protein
MEQSTPSRDQDALGNPVTDDQDRAFAAIVASIEGLDALGLADDAGRATVEPSSTFTWT